MSSPVAVQLFALANFPLIQAGDDIGALIVQQAQANGFPILDHDVVVIAQKIISKAENAVIAMRTLIPSEQAHILAQQTGRDLRYCEVVLQEGQVLGTTGRMMITRHRLGFLCTNSGIDRSNIAPYADDRLVVLPTDPDASAHRVQERILEQTGAETAVIISDTFGRADRRGAVGWMIGLAGIAAVEEYASVDLFGNPSRPARALVDELASAASLLMGQTNEGRPVVVIRGVSFTSGEHARSTDLYD